MNDQGAFEDGERIFSDEELAELSAQTIDLVKAAIDAGEGERAKELVDRMYGEFTHLHDGYMTWVGGLETYIYEHYGFEVLEAAEREAHLIEGRIAFKPSKETDLKARVKNLVSGLHGHVYQPMTITEDAQKIVITVDPCGSGGRLIEMGGYAPETGMATLKEAGNITWQFADYPIYCIHCPVMRAQDFERTGNLGFVKRFRDGKPGPACEYIFYKDITDTPEEAYKALGKEKPAK